MRKYALMFLTALLSVAVSGCNDDDDTMDTKLIKGQWEVVSEDCPEYTCIYDFTTRSELTWSWGNLNTYYLSASGNPIYDKSYSWHVSDPVNENPVYLDIVLKKGDETVGEPVYYIVEKLTASEMILRETGESKPQIQFRRRNDLTL